MKLSLVIFAIYLQSASTQQTETETHHDLTESLDLCRVAKRSFMGACVFMFMFFCLKKYGDYRAKQIVAENPGPFGAMSDISVYDMTLFQKQAVLEVLFTDDKCLRFQKQQDSPGQKEETNTNLSLKSSGTDGTDETDETDEEELSPTSIIIDEAKTTSNNKTTCGTGNNKLDPPTLPALEECEVGRHRVLNLRKLPLRRRPLFSPIPSHPTDDEDDNKEYVDDVEMNAVDDVEMNAVDDVEMNAVDGTNVEEVGGELSRENFHVATLNDMYDCEENTCSICLDEYEHGDLMVKSKHCMHYFHKDCIIGWLEKNYSCPSCRVDMITSHELIDGISQVISKTGVKREIKIRSEQEVYELTPPSSPVRSNRRSAQQ